MPLATRLKLFEEVIKLRRDSRSYREIRAEVTERYHISLVKSTLSNWVNGSASPTRIGHAFVPRSTPELAYVIGVKMGDASLNLKQKTYQYRTRLQAVDREFVEAFNQSVAKSLGIPAHRLWKGKTSAEIHVEFGSYRLYQFLWSPFQTFVPFIEHNKRCVSAFARGFFDSEGCVATDGTLTASNSNLELLRYVRYLLSRYFGIETTGPYLGTRKGSIITRRGKSYQRRVDCHSIHVRRRSLGRFREGIGLTIVRKRRRLDRVLGIGWFAPNT